MNVRWYVEEGCFPEHEQSRRNSLCYILEEQGCPVHVGRYKYDLFDKDGPVVFNSSINTLRDVLSCSPKPWEPCGWMELGILKCSWYYTKLHEFILQQRYAYYPLGALPYVKNVLFECFSSAGDTPALGRLLFIRPDDNEKSFVGGCVGSRYFETWWRSVINNCSPATMCVVAPFQQIRREWRLVMAAGHVVAGSLYKVGNNFVFEAGYPDPVGEFAERVAAEWSPHPVWVLDVAEVDDQLRVCELGSVNCAGLYDCDMHAVVKAINNAAVVAYEEHNAQSSDTGRQACVGDI